MQLDIETKKLWKNELKDQKISSAILLFVEFSCYIRIINSKQQVLPTSDNEDNDDDIANNAAINANTMITPHESSLSP